MDGPKPMYGEALEALEQAALYYPEDETIHYLIGIAAGNLSASEYFSPQDQERHLSLAEHAYLRAIELDQRYGKALYGLSVLYVYMEPRRPQLAIPYLNRFLDINKSDTDALFVLANALYQTWDFQGAVDCYDKITDLSKDPERKKNAQELKQQVLYEWN
jgi:tetratricopeptide (TPR) repeat protein